MSFADESRYKLKRTTLHGEMECPYCSELIKQTAKVCPYCQTDFEEQNRIARAEAADQNNDEEWYELAWQARYLTIPCGLAAGLIAFFTGIDYFNATGSELLWVGIGSLIIAFFTYVMTMVIIVGILLIAILAAFAHFMGWIDVMTLW